MSPQVNLNTPLAIDESGRDKIIYDLDKNLFVVAGAGSGKTSLLVARMVALVEKGVDISKIVAITFTKKAAAEFRERFQKTLKERSVVPMVKQQPRHGQLPDPTTTTAPRCQEALKKIDLCFTGTIDAFINLILSEYPNNAGIPSSSAVVEEDEYARLCRNAYRDIINNGSPDLQAKAKVFNLFFRNPADTYKRSISDVMKASYLDLEYSKPTTSLAIEVASLSAKYERFFKEDIEELEKHKGEVSPRGLESLADFEKALPLLKSKWTEQNFYAISKKLKRIASLEFCFTNALKTNIYEFKHRPKIDNGVYGITPPKDNPQLTAYLEETQMIVYRHSMDFLYNAALELRKSFKKQGYLSFDEYLYSFRDMILKDIDNGRKLSNHILSKYSHFLIDESQDTSPVQTELFIYLTSRNNNKNVQTSDPKPGSLFIVGDPKQSIYRFRGADVDAYLRNSDLFDKVYDQRYNEVVNLCQNFRSTNELCSYFNNQFQNLPNFTPIPIHQNRQTPPQIANSVLSGLYLSGSYQSTIEELVGKHYIFDRPLFEKEEKNLKEDPRYYDNKPRTYGKRLICYKDIMLLTWSKTKHSEIFKELEDRHIPFYCDGKIDLSASDVLQTIYSLYGYLIGESGQFQNVLVSPLFNVDIKNVVGYTSIDDLPYCDEKIFLMNIEPLKNIKNPIKLYESIVENLQLFKFIDYTHLEYVVFALEKMKEAYQNGLLSDVQSGEAFLKDMLANTIDHCVTLSPKPDAVYLANVHKVKGLEKPVVILVESSKGSDKPTQRLDFKNNKSYIFSTGKYKWKDLTLFDIQSGNLYQSQQDQEVIDCDKECFRLAYVAATRARNILAIPFSTRKNSRWASIRPDGVLPSIPNVDIETKEPDYAGEFEFSELPSFNQKATYNTRRPSAEVVIDSSFGNGVGENDDAVVHDEMKIGSMVHRLMQIIVESNGKMPKDKAISLILKEFGVENTSKYEQILNLVYDTMFKGGYPQKDGVPQNLLSIVLKAEHQCEVPFALKDGNDIWSGIVDLIYTIDGKTYIVDYKTSSKDFDLLDEVYIKQLEAYQKYYKEITGVDAEIFLYRISV